MKTTFLSAIFLLTIATGLFGTSCAPISLPDLVKTSTYILAGDVVDVRLVDKNGQEVTDPDARTGPGLENTIHLEVMVDPKLILKSTGTPVPKEISITLDPMRHLTLEQSRTYLKEKSFFFLDKEFRPVHPGQFHVPVAEQKKLEAILRRLRNP